MRKLLIGAWFLLGALFPSSFLSQSFEKRDDYFFRNFLLRLRAKDILDNYDPYFTVSFKRFDSCLISKSAKFKGKLSELENKILREYLEERDLNLSQIKKEGDSSIYGKFSFFHPSFLFVASDSLNNYIAANAIVRSQNLFEITSKRAKSELYYLRWGGVLYLNYMPFFAYIKSTNGKTFGKNQKKLWKYFPETRNNVKLQDYTEPGERYIDDTEGAFSIDLDNICFKVGREKAQIGYGEIKEILDINVPRYDFASLYFRSDFFNYSFFHSKFLGTQSGYRDSSYGDVIKYEEKYFVFHRFWFNFSKELKLGISEGLIYSRRGLDLSYLNPFNFYKSVEHSNFDRDNALMQFDLSSNAFKNLFLYFSLLIDDINFAKINTGWHGNSLAYNFGGYYFGEFSDFLYEAYFQVYLINPYVFSHRIPDNSFSHSGIPLIYPLNSNSANFLLGGKFIFGKEYFVDLKTFYQIAAKNKLDNNGNLIKNYGSDITIGHRTFDDKKAKFLSGEKETKISFRADYFRKLSKNLDLNFIVDFVIQGNRKSYNQTFSFYSLFNLKI